MEAVDETPASALVIAAHPDDAEFGCGGTVAQWVGRGATVRFLLLTSGDKGTHDPHVNPFALAALRERDRSRDDDRDLADGGGVGHTKREEGQQPPGNQHAAADTAAVGGASRVGEDGVSRLWAQGVHDL